MMQVLQEEIFQWRLQLCSCVKDNRVVNYLDHVNLKSHIMCCVLSWAAFQVYTYIAQNYAGISLTT